MADAVLTNYVLLKKQDGAWSETVQWPHTD